MAATQDEIDRVVAGYENAKNAVEYANTIIVEMQSVNGEDYNMVWSTVYPAV